MIQFYTKDSEFFIDCQKVMKNGEILAEGKIFIFQLLLGYPAFIIVQPDNEFLLPVVIKTDTVISLLPENEIFDGEKPQKNLFFVCFKQGDLDMFVSVPAIEPFHAEQIIKLYYGQELEIFEVKERGVC